MLEEGQERNDIFMKEIRDLKTQSTQKLENILEKA